MGLLDKLKALTYRARVTIELHTIYTLAETIGEVFFSLYLWRLTNSLVLVAQYNFWLWLSFTISFVLIGYLFRGKGMAQLYRLSFLLQFLFYGVLIYLQDSVIGMVGCLGVLFGLGSAFYWSATEVMMLSGTSDKLREMFFGVLMSGEHIARIAGPALAAGLIGLGITWQRSELFGYYLLFLAMALLFLGAELAVRKTKEVTFERFSLRGAFKLYQRKAWRWNLWRSFADGLMVSRAFVWSVFSYLVLQSEIWLGTMMSLVGILGIVSNMLIGHWFKPSLRNKLNSWGTILLVVAGVIYPLLLNPVGLSADQVLGEIIGVPLFMFAWLAWFFVAVETDYEGEERQFEYFAGHEIWQGTGRVISIGAFWVLASRLEQITLARWWFGGLSLLFIVQWYLVKKVRLALIRSGYNEE